MKPLIFLDIDGVLVTQRMLILRHPLWHYNRFDPPCVSQLNRIIAETGAEIVVSSSWRHDNWDILVKYIEEEGVTGLVRDRTPYRGGEPRGNEIAWWLHEEDYKGNFVILDDDSDMTHLHAHHLLTTMEKGLTREIATCAIDLLKG